MLVIAGSCEADVYCVIDALHECDEQNREQLMRLINAYFRKPSASTKLKLLVSGRPYFDPQYKFQMLTASISSYQVHLAGEDEHLGEDIALVTKAKVQALENWDPATKERLQNSLLELNLNTKSFLWLRLVLAELQWNPEVPGARPHTMRRLTMALPHTVNGLNDKMLRRSFDPSRARAILKAIFAAERPLSLAELRVIDGIIKTPDANSYDDLELQDDRNFRFTVRASCGHLVSFTANRVQFFHQTVRDFLAQCNGVKDTQSDRVWQHSIVPVAAHHLMFATSIRLREFGELQRPLTEIFLDIFCPSNDPHGFRYPWTPAHRQGLIREFERFPFPAYTARFWRKHYRATLGNSEHVKKYARLSAYDISSTVFWLCLSCHFILDYPLCEISPEASFAQCLTEVVRDQSFRVSTRVSVWLPQGYINLKSGNSQFGVYSEGQP